jgi:hypothetical protein
MSTASSSQPALRTKSRTKGRGCIKGASVSGRSRKRSTDIIRKSRKGRNLIADGSDREG